MLIIYIPLDRALSPRDKVSKIVYHVQSIEYLCLPMNRWYGNDDDEDEEDLPPQPTLPSKKVVLIEDEDIDELPSKPTLP